MAREKYLSTGLKPVPMIFGAEGKRFLESMSNPKKLSKEKIDRMKKNYEIYQRAIEIGKNTEVRK
ncbi:MAG: hypothetical protein MJZ14_00320 [Paludibacteraceae bacterium]|nr:hypothetical protein [Paludibacteraceae bacterium]